MSKLYWKLRQAMTLKNQKCGAIVIFSKRNKYRSPILNTYKCNRWGSGYWRNKKEWKRLSTS